jgi:hypothetical protein
MTRDLNTIVGDTWQPVAKATGREDREPSFGPRHTEQRKLAHFSVFSDERGEFSVFSQAVQFFSTAC